MHNTKKQLAIYTVLFSILIAFTGCIFFRMLELRDQLTDFETNFDLNDERGLTLVFKNPILSSDDVIWLLKGSPVSITPEEQSKLWTYMFQKQYLAPGSEDDEYDIPILMVIQDDKLTEITFPERFLKSLSIPLLKKMLSSMGNADISKLSRSASSKYTGSDLIEIPNLDNVIDTLGVPYQIEDQGENYRISYLYYLEDAEGNASSDNLNLELWFFASNGDKTLKSVVGKIRGIKLSMDFETVQE